MIKNLSITDMYMSVLVSLSVDEKLDLISKLKASIRNNKRTDTLELDDPFACYKGDWGDELTSEDYAESLRKSHTFNRTVDTW